MKKSFIYIKKDSTSSTDSAFPKEDEPFINTDSDSNEYQVISYNKSHQSNINETNPHIVEERKNDQIFLPNEFVDFYTADIYHNHIYDPLTCKTFNLNMVKSGSPSIESQQPQNQSSIISNFNPSSYHCTFNHSNYEIKKNGQVHGNLNQINVNSKLPSPPSTSPSTSSITTTSPKCGKKHLYNNDDDKERKVENCIKFKNHTNYFNQKYIHSYFGGSEQNFNYQQLTNSNDNIKLYKHKHFNSDSCLSKYQTTYLEKMAEIRTKTPHFSPIENVEEVQKGEEFNDVCCDRKFRRLCFMFIILCLAILTVKDVIDLVIEYTENPKKADMNIMFNETMGLPNVTFCMSRDQAWSHFKISPNETDKDWESIIGKDLSNMTTKDQFMNNQWDQHTIMEAYDVIANLNSLERETDAHGAVRTINVFKSIKRFERKRKAVKKWLKVIQDRNVTFNEFTQKVGTEVIRRSLQRFNRETKNESLIIKTQLKVSWISMMQLCFQPMYDEKNYHRILDQGIFFTMMLSHNADNLEGKDLECMSVDFHGRPSSSARFMQGKGRVKDGFIDELCHGQRHEVTVEIRARYVMLENDDEATACREAKDDEDNEFDCRSRCRLNFLRDICKCIPSTLSYLVKDEDEKKKYPLCDYESCPVNQTFVQRGNFSHEECSNLCYRDCDQFRFEVDHEKKGRMVRPDLTLVELHWGSFEYLTLQQDWVWTVPTFIAALGGSIGMWLGLSILSLIQGSAWIYKYLHQEVVRKKSIVPTKKRDKDIPLKIQSLNMKPNSNNTSTTPVHHH